LPETNPGQAGINGILGVGLFAQDCGAECAAINGFGSMYFSCSGGNCSGTTVPLANQVTNPVSALPLDNNGVILDMPSVPPQGSAQVTGSLILGIDTESNNSSSGFTKYQADEDGFFTTSFSEQTYNESFIDSGSNGYFFPNPGGWNECDEFYCTGEYTENTATVTDAYNQSSSSVCFTVGDAGVLGNSGNHAFSDVGADIGFENSFDWGMPFFYGRQVFVGIQGAKSNLGVGPYWAY
jgi:hypothetical protein